MKFAKLAIISLFVLATSAHAAVTFDPATGTGFVGRGDIISTLGQQALGTNIVFAYTETATYQQTCMNVVSTPGTTQTNILNRPRHAFINGSVNYETRNARGNGNITGYILGGYASVIESQDIYACPTGWTLVSVTAIAVSGGVLTANGVALSY